MKTQIHYMKTDFYVKSENFGAFGAKIRHLLYENGNSLYETLIIHYMKILIHYMKNRKSAFGRKKLYIFIY